MKLATKFTRHTTHAWHAALPLLLALVTPLLEKNPAKRLAEPGGLTMVFSMARCIVLGFALAMLHQIWRAGVAGWPEATLSIAVVLALPVLAAMERVKPEAALALAGALVRRFGEGAARPMGSVFTDGDSSDDDGVDREPSKYDDHRDDHRDDHSTRRPRRKAA